VTLADLVGDRERVGAENSDHGACVVDSEGRGLTG
jgi:hypothetical protein